MKHRYLLIGAISVLPSIWQNVTAHTATLYFDYVATNADIGKGGSIAQGTNGLYREVATLTITDLSDLQVSGGRSADGSRNYANGGVRLTFSNLHSTDIFGSNSTALTTIGSFELNAPETTSTSTDFDSNYHNWGNNSGVKLAFSDNPDNGGIEWEEDGCTTASNTGSCSTAENTNRAKWEGWAQQFNYGGNNGTNVDNASHAIAFTQGLTSSIDIYNSSSVSTISVLGLLSNPIGAVSENSTQLPLAFGWLNAVTGLPNNTDPNKRAVAANGWWGTSINATSTSNINNQVQVLATHYSLDGAPVTSTSANTECLFNSLESDPRYQQYLQPKNSATSSAGEYVFRFYAQTKNYLGVSSANKHIYYLDASGQLIDLTSNLEWPLANKLIEYKCL